MASQAVPGRHPDKQKKEAIRLSIRHIKNLIPTDSADRWKGRQIDTQIVRQIG